MDVEDALRRAILADPADGLAWAALADFVEELGRDDQARLMRRHRALMSLSPDAPDRADREAEIHAMLLGGVEPYTISATNSLGMTFAYIPAGTFLMGSPDGEVGSYDDEQPRRVVTLSKSFHLGVYPVTQGEYLSLVGLNPSAFCGSGRESRRVRGLDTRRFPVDSVSWHDAVNFCRLLTRRPEDVAAGRTYRLPTEAEWEYACRAGTLTVPFPWGPAMSIDQAHYLPPPSLSAAPDSAAGRTREVGSYQPNAFGLHDMVGNVWEWCADWFSPDAYSSMPATDPHGPATGDGRVARGGAFHLPARRLRCADRSRFAPDQRQGELGFRVVMEAG